LSHFRTTKVSLDATDKQGILAASKGSISLANDKTVHNNNDSNMANNNDIGGSPPICNGNRFLVSMRTGFIIYLVRGSVHTSPSQLFLPVFKIYSHNLNGF